MSALVKVQLYVSRYRGQKRPKEIIAIWPGCVVIIGPHEKVEPLLMAYGVGLDDPFDHGTYTSDAEQSRLRLVSHFFPETQLLEILTDSFLSNELELRSRAGAIVEVGGKQIGTLLELVRERRRTYNI